MKFIKLSVTSAACVLLLTACGGESASEYASRVVQGFWSGAVSQAPDGATSVDTALVPGETAWIIFANGTTATGFAKIPVAATYTNDTEASVSGKGFYFKLGSATRQNISLTGIATTGNTFTGSSQLGNATAFNLSLKGNEAYRTAPKTSDVTATWSGTTGGNTVTLTWTVDSVGAVTGNSTTGCTYGGTIKPNAAGVAVLDVAVTESCSGTNKTLSGIATLTSSKTSLAVAYTTAGDAEGGLLQLAKQ